MAHPPLQVRRRPAGVLTLAAALTGLSGMAFAQNTPVQAYPTKDPDCLAWSDGCVICARDEQAKSHCSTPGIACIPVAVTCRVSKKSP